MDKIFRYAILEELKLILEYYKGDILLDDFIDLEKELYDDVMYNSSFDVLLDVSESNLKISESDMKNFLEFSQPNVHLKYGRKTALITNTPAQVVSSIFYISYYCDKVKYEIFSTIEGALEWLRLSARKIEISEYLTDLKHSLIA